MLVKHVGCICFGHTTGRLLQDPLDIQSRKLGNPTIAVSVICLGGMTQGEEKPQGFPRGIQSAEAGWPLPNCPTRYEKTFASMLAVLPELPLLINYRQYLRVWASARFVLPPKMNRVSSSGIGCRVVVWKITLSPRILKRTSRFKKAIA